MLNDICLLCCHLPQTLFHHTPVYSVQDVPISRQIIATVYQNYIDSVQNAISVYLDIDTKMINVIIYDISISSIFYRKMT